ncbi:MAG: hypothetical protein KGM24_05145 [Elusimicrobia bacterium]|nr:hypothetical protein [Elusimicrobiota bacterium]
MMPTASAALPSNCRHIAASFTPVAARSGLRVLRELEERSALEEFFRAEHKTALARAAAMLGSTADAEDVVSETFREFLEGKTDRDHFYRALKSNIADRRRRMARERRRESSLERHITPRMLSIEECAWGVEGVDCVAVEPSSSRADDRDPLDVLIAREDLRTREREVESALRDPRWRYIKRRKWARPLAEKCAESRGARE